MNTSSLPPSISSVVCRFGLSHLTVPRELHEGDEAMSLFCPQMAGLSLPHVALTTSTTTIPGGLLINYSSEIVLLIHPSQTLPSEVADSL